MAYCEASKLFFMCIDWAKLYSLSNERMSRDGVSKTKIYIYGFEFTYSTEICGNSEIFHMYRTSSVFCNWVSQTITDTITAENLRHLELV